MKRKPTKQPALFDDAATDARVITDIAPLARDPNLMRIKVDGKTVATLRVGEAEGLKLRMGMSWTESLAARVEHAESLDAARKHLLRLLSARPYSKQQAKAKLLAKSHTERVVNEVITQAERDGWLNDRTLADGLVQAATARKPAGRRLLEQKLKQRGVEASAANAALSKHAGQDDRRAAWDIARRRVAIMGALKPEVALRRISGLLMRRGFDEHIVEETIERLQPLLSDAHDGNA